MQRTVLIITLLSISTGVFATPTTLDQQCFIMKYQAFVNASDNWYTTLLNKVSEQHPTLNTAAEQFFTERHNYVERNLTAVKWYLEHAPEKLALDKPVNEWLTLDSASADLLSQQSHEFKIQNEQVVKDRLVKPNPQNYALRTAFADLLTHPENVKVGIDAYNSAMEKIEREVCRK